jgi:hypothetical protein
MGTQCTTDSTGCTCKYTITPNQTTCGPLDVPAADGICCVYSLQGKWPDQNGRCQCLSGTPVCVDLGGGDCACFAGNMPGTGETVTSRCSAPAGGHCCHAANGYCGCGSAACDAGQTEVADCNDKTIQCPNNEIQIDSCSI